MVESQQRDKKRRGLWCAMGFYVSIDDDLGTCTFRVLRTYHCFLRFWGHILLEGVYCGVRERVDEVYALFYVLPVCYAQTEKMRKYTWYRRQLGTIWKNKCLDPELVN